MSSASFINVHKLPRSKTQTLSLIGHISLAVHATIESVYSHKAGLDEPTEGHGIPADNLSWSRQDAHLSVFVSLFLCLTVCLSISLSLSLRLSVSLSFHHWHETENQIPSRCAEKSVSAATSILFLTRTKNLSCVVVYKLNAMTALCPRLTV